VCACSPCLLLQLELAQLRVDLLGLVLRQVSLEGEGRGHEERCTHDASRDDVGGAGGGG
jgi:hypothetical protein